MTSNTPRHRRPVVRPHAPTRPVQALASMLFLAAALAVMPASAVAQDGAVDAVAAADRAGAMEAAGADAVREELMSHFETSMGKFIALAEAMPAESFTWSPGDGVMEVGQVYMHVAAYNYFYPGRYLEAAWPEGVDMEAIDAMEAVRNKEAVVRALEESRAWVREVIAGMDGEALAAGTRLYGRDVQGWAVLTQLVSHMNEHLGQSIAYARMNDVVPPWSR